MTDPPGPDERPDVGTLDAPLKGEGEQASSGEVIYRPLQAWSRPHPADGVVSVHFATREYPERQFTLTATAARELAIQLMRHSKRVRRAVDSTDDAPSERPFEVTAPDGKPVTPHASRGDDS